MTHDDAVNERLRKEYADSYAKMLALYKLAHDVGTEFQLPFLLVGPSISLEVTTNTVRAAALRLLHLEAETFTLGLALDFKADSKFPHLRTKQPSCLYYCTRPVVYMFGLMSYHVAPMDPAGRLCTGTTTSMEGSRIQITCSAFCCENT